MPEASITRKRRFYGLLDKLGPGPVPVANPSKTSAPTRQPVTISPVSSAPRPGTPSTPSPRPSISGPRPIRPDRPSTLATPGAPPPIPRIIPPDSNTISISPHDAARMRPGTSDSNASVDSYRSRLNPHAVTGIGARTGSFTSLQVDGNGRPNAMQLGRPTSAGKRSAEQMSRNSMETITVVASPKEAEKKPHFTPWSHEDFLERLKTFAPITSWFPKPEGVGEVEWAKRGWECVGGETVACQGCQKRVLVDFSPSQYAEARTKRRKLSTQQDDDEEEEEENDFGTAMVEAINGIVGMPARTEKEDEDSEDEDSEEEAEFENSFEKALAEKYAEEITNGHSESCPWRKTGCKDDIYHLPVVRTAWWQDTVRTAFTSILEIKEDIEHLRIRRFEATPPIERILINLPPSFFSQNAVSRSASVISIGGGVEDPTAPSEDLMRRAMTMAMMGWRAAYEARTNLLVCDACFQRIGLWMYQGKGRAPSPTPTTTTTTVAPLSRQTTTGPDTPESATSTSLTPAIKSVSFAACSPSASPDPSLSSPDAAVLDLLAQHRDYCPYRSATSQAATGDFANQPAWRILWTTVARYADEQRRRSAAGRAALGGAISQGQLGLGLGLGGNLSREELARLDKERITKLRRLKSALGIKLKAAKGKIGGTEQGGTGWV